eukprot:TRINITY_DN17658_c1_g1_i2.p3 TRINITY_DN17658_c1_g1~~TRINITY_DN17658_c1_g1_i2.p3  ORF type:complete len:151 (+),score=9.88 TRINITY_DN17658_c1_g1_i2:998-1450(+)
MLVQLQLNNSTCTLLSINKETCRVEALNMGDSGYIIYRKVGKKLEEVFHSEDLQHDFNLPYQVGTGGDNPRMAHRDSHTLYPGDLVVLATDGLWDNVRTEEVRRVIEDCLKKYGDTNCLSKMASELATLARKNSLNRYNTAKITKTIANS